MFVAALLDAFPEHWPRVQAAIASLNLGPPSECRLTPHRDHVFVGSRFLVAADTPSAGVEPADHFHEASHSHEPGDPLHGSAFHAGHRAWSDIRAELAHSGLEAQVKKHAIGIFQLLADAEARVHGIAAEAIAFHEVGAVDSIIDIVASAQLIALIGAERWTSAPLPLGSGRVRGAHGVLPVPAPATAILMQGLPVIDDGVPGERVTPTGAALARYLIDAGGRRDGRIRQLSRSGVGFGARTLPGISNCLRALAFDETTSQGLSAEASPIGRRQLAVVTFEVDDQSAEDLAVGLDHIRATHGVLDVTQSSALGKKGRMAAHVQVLVAPADLETAIVACFEETTTIGLRYQMAEGAVLRRRLKAAEIDGETLQVKIVDRPAGAPSAKTETADVSAHRGHGARARLRRGAEARALHLDAHDEEGGR